MGNRPRESFRDGEAIKVDSCSQVMLGHNPDVGLVFTQMYSWGTNSLNMNVATTPTSTPHSNVTQWYVSKYFT